jgi:RNA polymerase sigma-70 factor (ECF subfamily)
MDAYQDAHTHHRDEKRLRFERIFTAHYGDVLAYVRRRDSLDVADDVVGETFLVTWRRLEDVPEEPLAWLLSVARRVLANQIRGDRRRQALRAKAVSVESNGAMDPGQGESDEILAALAQLPAAEREAITLVAWEGLSPSQAATVLGCSNMALRARLYRARRRLSRALNLQHIAVKRAVPAITAGREAP